MSEVAVEVNGLGKTYGSLTAVDNVSFTIGAGEIFGLLGPNGAGKTTTLSMLATLLKPTSGMALVNGYDVSRDSAKVRKSIGMVFQEPSSDDILTGWENLYAHALMFGVPRRERRERISRVLRLVNMEDRAEDLVKKYSGGMRRRLELARGLLHNPRILLLDEPTLGLDPQTREHIWEYIEDLAKTNNVTVILTTHYMDEADRLCDRVAIIDHGKIVALDNPGRLKAQLGGEVVKIKSQTIDLGKLRGLDFISSVKQADGYVLLTVQKSSMHLQDILNRVGVVESVEVHPTTLNDVFLHYTGHEIRDESGEGGTMERIAQYEGRSR